MPRNHELKIWPPYFRAVAEGRKTFEVRKNDRGFEVGDELRLHEWDPHQAEQRGETWGYTGRSAKVIVTYVMHGGDHGIDRGYSVLGFRDGLLLIP